MSDPVSGKGHGQGHKQLNGLGHEQGHGHGHGHGHGQGHAIKFRIFLAYLCITLLLCNEVIYYELLYFSVISPIYYPIVLP